MRISGGVSADTLFTTCESQTTSFGFSVMRARAAANSRSLTIRLTASLSRMSRRVCTCGRISRPFGAPRSIGTTSTTRSPGPIRSPTSRGSSMLLSGACRNSASLTRSIPRCSAAAIVTVSMFSVASCTSCSAGGSPRSALLKTTANGVCASRSVAISSFSVSVSPPASTTTSATSTRSSTWRVFSIRSAPSAPTSSSPAVSINTTGPSGANSNVFSTGSVVVPG